MAPKYIARTLGLLALGASVQAADLTIHLENHVEFSRHSVRFECDANGAKMGLPSGVFTVEYINGGDNSLAIVPVNGKSLIFANVISGSGARYAARQYIWWDAGGRGVNFYSDTLGGKAHSACRNIK